MDYWCGAASPCLRSRRHSRPKSIPFVGLIWAACRPRLGLRVVHEFRWAMGKKIGTRRIAGGSKRAAFWIQEGDVGGASEHAILSLMRLTGAKLFVFPFKTEGSPSRQAGARRQLATGEHLSLFWLASFWMLFFFNHGARTHITRVCASCGFKECAQLAVYKRTKRYSIIIHPDNREYIHQIFARSFTLNARYQSGSSGEIEQLCGVLREWYMLRWVQLYTNVTLSSYITGIQKICIVVLLSFPTTTFLRHMQRFIYN